MQRRGERVLRAFSVVGIEDKHADFIRCLGTVVVVEVEVVEDITATMPVDKQRLSGRAFTLVAIEPCVDESASVS